MLLLFGDKADINWGQGCCYLGTTLLLLEDKAAVFKDNAAVIRRQGCYI